MLRTLMAGHPPRSPAEARADPPRRGRLRPVCQHPAQPGELRETAREGDERRQGPRGEGRKGSEETTCLRAGCRGDRPGAGAGGALSSGAGSITGLRGLPPRPDDTNRHPIGWVAATHGSVRSQIIEFTSSVCTGTFRIKFGLGASPQTSASLCPGRGGWAASRAPKGCRRLDSGRSGHTPGFGLSVPSGERTGGGRSILHSHVGVSLFPPLPSSSSKKIN